MNESPRRRLPILPGVTVAQRFTLVLIVMVILVAAAASVGLWFAASIQRNSQSMSRAAGVSGKLMDLQTSWLSMVGTVNIFSIVAPPAETRQLLENQLDGYDKILIEIASQPFGTTAEAISANQKTMQELTRVRVDIRALADQIYRSIEEGNWIAAVQTRQSEVNELQSRFETALNQLNTNLQGEISTMSAEIQRVQRTIRNIGIAIVLLGIALSVWFGWVNRRYTFKPLDQLIDSIQKITQVTSSEELHPATPLPQRDEIGDLSKAIAQMTERVRQSYETLEQRITERTQGLERRTLQLQVAAEVARDIASTPDPEQLLNQAVNLIRDRFGFYHAGVFLNDERHEFEVLRAATGEAGREMLERQHKLRIGETGLVGYVALSGESRIALDVGLDAVHFKNPLLPETRSEVALPIRIGNRVIGVLDVQSTESAAFDQDSVTTLQIIADQLAIAIQNARLLREAQESLSELEKTYGRYDVLDWERLLQSVSTIGYQYDGMNVSPIGDSDGDMKAAEMEAESPDGPQPLSIPIRVRGETIGALDVWPQVDKLSVSETNILANVSNRLSQILESARLFEETRARAAREETINRLTADFSRSLDTDSVLQTAVREMAGLPSVVEATIFLETPSEDATSVDASSETAPSIGAPSSDAPSSDAPDGIKGDGGV